jgi:hypothetical protein
MYRTSTALLAALACSGCVSTQWDYTGKDGSHIVGSRTAVAYDVGDLDAAVTADGPRVTEKNAAGKLDPAAVQALLRALGAAAP